jgi:hypothetical protein
LLTIRRPVKRFVVSLAVAAFLVGATVACGGNAEAHYTLAKSKPCLAGLGQFANPSQFGGAGVAGTEAMAEVMKPDAAMIDLIFMKSPKVADAYLSRGFPPGLTATKGNVVIWIRQPYVGRAKPSASDRAAVESCLA